MCLPPRQRVGPRFGCAGTLSSVRNWPEPVERVAAVVRERGADVRLEEFSEGTPTAADAARAIGCDARADRQVARLRLRREPGARARARRPARRRGEGRGGRRAAGYAADRAARRRSSRPPASSRARSRRSRPRTSAGCSSSASCCSRRSSGSAPGRRGTWPGSRRSTCCASRAPCRSISPRLRSGFAR